MICEPIDTEAPRFRVITIEGYPIPPAGGRGGKSTMTLVATVIDSFYGTEHGRFASSDYIKAPWAPGSANRRGHEGAVRDAEERCAELNAWHEREGWGEDVPLAS
jgi:hypothetical protein